MHFYLTQDIRKQVKRIAEFLEVSLTDEDIEKVVHGSDFNTMKKDYEKNNDYKKFSNLFRKGTRRSRLFGKIFRTNQILFSDCYNLTQIYLYFD